MITHEEIKELVDYLHGNPERDLTTGRVDTAWVSLCKLKIDTYLRLLGDASEDGRVDIEI